MIYLNVLELKKQLIFVKFLYLLIYGYKNKNF